MNISPMGDKKMGILVLFVIIGENKTKDIISKHLNYYF